MFASILPCGAGFLQEKKRKRHNQLARGCGKRGTNRRVERLVPARGSNGAAPEIRGDGSEAPARILPRRPL